MVVLDTGTIKPNVLGLSLFGLQRSRRSVFVFLSKTLLHRPIAMPWHLVLGRSVIQLSSRSAHGSVPSRLCHWYATYSSLGGRWFGSSAPNMYCFVSFCLGLHSFLRSSILFQQLSVFWFGLRSSLAVWVSFHPRTSIRRVKMLGSLASLLLVWRSWSVEICVLLL